MKNTEYLTWEDLDRFDLSDFDDEILSNSDIDIPIIINEFSSSNNDEEENIK